MAKAKTKTKSRVKCATGYKHPKLWAVFSVGGSICGVTKDGQPYLYHPVLNMWKTACATPEQVKAIEAAQQAADRKTIAGAESHLADEKRSRAEQ